MGFRSFRGVLLYLLFSYPVFYLCSAIYRLIFFTSFGTTEAKAAIGSYLGPVTYQSFRFDTTVITYLMIPLVLLALVALFVPARTERGIARYRRIAVTWSVIALLIYVLVAVCDFYYYSFFNAHFNALIFGFVQDDTRSILFFIWKQYPVIRIILFVVVLILVFRFVFRRLFVAAFAITARWRSPRFAPFIIVPVTLFLVFIAMRGSATFTDPNFPLLLRDANVSPDPFVNLLPVNPVFALKEALSDDEGRTLDGNWQAELERFGYKDPQSALNDWWSAIDGKASFFDTTAVNESLRADPPNIVFVQMESMNGQYLDFQSPDCDLLGRLKDVLQQCYLYRNFVSNRMLTIHSLEQLVMNTPLTPVSHSAYQHHQFSTGATLPFIRSGYEARYLTGGSLGWENTEQSLPPYFNKPLEGDKRLLELFPKAYTNEWGVHDEYLFERVWQLLRSEKKPQLLYAMTISNHPSFSVPPTYTPRQINLSDSLKKMLRVSEADARKHLIAYQYANDCLGAFLQKLVQSELGKNTIVAVTGDHHSGYLLNNPTASALQDLSVPLLLYVPEKYRPKHYVHTDVFASHRDIFPTLSHLALSGAPYYKTGVDLLTADTALLDRNVAIHENYVFSKAGALQVNDGSQLFYRWKAPYRELENADTASAKNSLYRSYTGYKAAAGYFIKQQIADSKK